MNEDWSEQAAKKRRTAYDATDSLNCAISDQNNAIMEMLQHSEVYVTIDLTSIDSSGNTALHLVFQHYDEPEIVQILEIFFDQRVDLNVANAKHETPLHLAVAKRMRTAVELLIRHGADVRKCDEAGNLLTHYFVEDEYDKFLTISKLDGFIKRDVAESESASFVDFLVSLGLDFAAPNLYGWTALHMAVERNLQHVLPTILKRATNLASLVDEKGRTLLHLFLQTSDKYRKGGSFGAPSEGVWSVGFSRRYSVEIARILLDAGVSAVAVDASGDTALHLAARNKEDLELVNLLLHRFTSVHRRNNFGDTVFHECIRSASSKFSSKAAYYLEIARGLLTKGADPNGRDRYGVAPVHYTVAEKKLPAIELMRRHNADFAGYVSKSGQNLLHLLAFKHDNDRRSDRSWEAMFELIVEGVELDKLDKTGQSPLHLAIRHSNLAVARKLIARGADVNLKNAEGARPLDGVGSSKTGDGHCVLKLLLERGARVNARDNHGATALSHALSIKSRKNVEELLRHGADVNEPFFLDLVALHLHDLDDNPALEVVVRHWVKLKAAGIACSREYDSLVSVEDYREFYSECLEEVEALKCTFVDNDSVSLYLWLRMNPGERSARVNSERLKSIVENEKLDEQFPKYHVLIRGCYREAVARLSIVKPAVEAWRRVARINWPRDCVERILARLDNADLMGLAEA